MSRVLQSRGRADHGRRVFDGMARVTTQPERTTMKINPVRIGLFLWGALCLSVMAEEPDPTSEDVPNLTASSGTPLNHTTFQKCILSGRPLKECGEEMSDKDPLKDYIVNGSSAYTGLFSEKNWGLLEGGIWSPTPAELSRYWMM